MIRLCSCILGCSSLCCRNHGHDFHDNSSSFNIPFASGLFSTDSPLLLRPAQSFGPEGTRAPAAAAAVVRAPSAGAMVQGSSAAASAVPEGGSNTALLAEESSAEVLLSLVRLGGTGRG